VFYNRQRKHSTPGYRVPRSKKIQEQTDPGLLELQKAPAQLGVLIPTGTASLDEVLAK
jgi:hypothetical protein